jgi:uncharacterized protein
MRIRSDNCRSFPEATWNFRDVFVVSVVSLLVSFGVGMVLLLAFGNNKTTITVLRFVTAAVISLGPIFWLHSKYSLSVSVLGLRRGRIGVIWSFLVGILTATASTFALGPTLFGYSSEVIRQAAFYPFYSYFFMLLTIDGFGSLVLTPVSEEIMCRGFIYGYLRSRFGFLVGLAVQSLFFTLLHTGISHGTYGVVILTINWFIAGLILGLLYERTGSLLPPIICHSVINYFAFVFEFVRGPWGRW